MRVPVESGTPPRSERLVGDILRRTCIKVGDAACKEVCQIPGGYDDKARDCSDRNLSSALERLLDEGEAAIMVGVTKDRVGFYDKLDTYEEEGLVSTNSQGITEVSGFNAFFARAEDNVALGRRLADCGDVNLEFLDENGDMVFGFMHLTRTNLKGENTFRFGGDDEHRMGAFEYFLWEALSYYGGDPESVKVRVTAAVTGPNWPYYFSDVKDETTGAIVKTAEECMNETFPGWYEGGFLHNASYPEWRPGVIIEPTDRWEPDLPAMIRWQIYKTDIDPRNVVVNESIDPGNLALGHASNTQAAKGVFPDARDLYLTKIRRG